jgi:hypothetical protein
MTSDVAIRKIAVVTAGIAIAVLLGTALVAVPGVRERLGLIPTERAGYRVGEQVDAPIPPAVGAERRVVLFGRGTCGDCVRAAGFFHDLRSSVLHHNSSFVLVTQEPRTNAGREFAQQLAMDEDDIVWTDLQQLRLKVLPTVLVIDGTGRILFVKEGPIVSLDQDVVRGNIESALR